MLLSGQLMCRLEKETTKIYNKRVARPLWPLELLDGWSSRVSPRKMADGRPLLNFIALGFTMKNLC